MDAGVTPRRHNPVDSICRKLRTIRRRDQEADSPFPIPKLQSSSYGSPHASLRHNLEAVLRKRGIQPDDGPECEGSAAVLTPAGSSAPRRDSCPTPTLSTPGTPINATYTVTSTLREKGEAVPLYNRPWQRTCSTPAVQSRDVYFTPRCPTPMEVEREGGKTLSHTLLSYNLNFASSDTSSILDTELACPALVVKRLSMGDGKLPSESRRDGMAEVSLICEEDLLDTIFQACDTQCRGKVYVSHIVDYLRHTTSRSSEDSGLEELCNMLDPEHKDISIDLHTYHAIMKEWIEDCRNQGYVRLNEDLTQESVRPADGLAAKRSVLLNMTSGSLEAFGGEVSRADLETSDLVFCVADLQFNNQKLQQEVGKLKQAVEVMEETNQKLLEQNEELKAQTRAGQQLLQKERMLKEEVEEMKMTLSSSEESRARASAQSKHMERENQSLLAKIACLEKEVPSTQVAVIPSVRRMRWNSDVSIRVGLQVQTLTFDAVIAEKDAEIQEKARQTEELKTAVEEYSSVLELLRVEKSRLERQMQLMLMQPEMTLINQTGSGSLQAELALAQQSPSEGVEGSSLSLASSLDETLDREVLLLLRGPAPEQTALEFRTLLASLTQEFEEDTCAVLAQLRGLLNLQGPQDVELKLQGLRGQLAERRGRWMCAVGQLQQYTDSLEREMTKVTSDLRRSRTDMLHLSVRVQEQENKKQQLQEELDQMKTEHNSREARSQTPAHCCQVTSSTHHAHTTMPTASRPQEEGRLPECTRPADTHGQAHSFASVNYCFASHRQQFTSMCLLDVSQRSTFQSCLRASFVTCCFRQCNLEISIGSTPPPPPPPRFHVYMFVKHFIFLLKFNLVTHSSVSLSSYQAEFHRLSLSCKCDMFTLEKRLRLEERSRDLAEENVCREVSSCQGLLQALIPRCEDDNQAMEIIQRLQKNLEILVQSMTRVSSRSEMLGAIHQESRMGKAVEVMIHHVENLRRTYTKEHTELLELRESLVQNERSFGTERDDFRNKKQPSFNKVSSPVWITKLSRADYSQRAPLKRFISSGGWQETDGPALTNSVSSGPGPVAEQATPCQVKASRSPWLWVCALMVVSALLLLLASLILQPAVDAAPVGTGDSWMTIQQLLWPYTGLQHNGQPPV
uniref:Lymphoid-restricted membrane protein n=1 Tax=Electrophorus electricus TaxID=8005 RepID=A0A4W4FXM6_ELEEL